MLILRRNLLIGAAALAVTGPTAKGAQLQATPFSPKSLPGLKLWLDAGVGVFSDAGDTPATDGSTVQQVNDQSGLGNHATQPLSAYRPTFKTGQVNGLPAITFNGASNCLSNAYLGEPATVFVVYKVNSFGPPGSYQTLMGATAAGAPVIGAYYLHAISGEGTRRKAYKRALIDSGSDANWVVDQSPQAPWQIFGVVNDGNNLTLYDSATIINGPQPRTAAMRGIGTAAAIGAGYYNNTLADPFNGQIAEVIVYDRALTPPELTQVRSYLAGKFALDIAGPYLFYCFGAIDGLLYCLQSDDGASWARRPISYFPLDGVLVRDPSVCAFGSVYVIVHTAPSPGNPFGPETAFNVAASTDGVVFSHLAVVDCSAAVGNTIGSRVWAPEFVRNLDGSIYVAGDGYPRVVFAGSIIGNLDAGFQFYETHPTSPAGTTWSTPVQLTGFGLPANMIDPFPLTDGSRFYVWFKDETTKYVGYMTSALSLTAGYTVTRSGNWAGWGAPLEGAALFKLATGNWRIILDHQGGGLSYSDSADDWMTWSRLADLTYTQPMAVQHGTVIRA